MQTFPENTDTAAKQGNKPETTRKPETVRKLGKTYNKIRESTTDNERGHECDNNYVDCQNFPGLPVSPNPTLTEKPQQIMFTAHKTGTTTSRVPTTTNHDVKSVLQKLSFSLF